MIEDYLLVGRKILVTGASSGIGRECAKRLSMQGANLILTSRNLVGLKETLSLLSNGDHEIAVADLQKQDDLINLASSFTKLNGIVHCAGIHKLSLSKLITESEISKIMNINFVAPILLTKELIRKRSVEKKASIVFVSSIAANCPSVGTILYGASKAALNAAMRSFALEQAPMGIRVNCISPGMIKNDFMLKYNAGITQEQLFENETHYPLGYGTPEDIANIVVFIISDASRWITGADLIIDGGFSLK